MKRQNGEISQSKNDGFGTSVSALPYPTENAVVAASESGLFCPNCGARLEGRKCKLLCRTPGCGYVVTCSEW